MTHLGPEAVQAILDGVTMGTFQRAEGGEPSCYQRGPTVGKGSVGHYWVSPSRNACHQLGSSLERGS